MCYIEKQNLLYSSQYGFHNEHSTQQAILEILNDIQDNIWINSYFLVEYL